MPANRPEECDLQLMEAINRGDLQAAVAIYEPNATLVTDPSGTIVVGHDAIREFLRPALEAKLQMAREVFALQNAGGDLALTGGRWKLTGVDPDGNPVTMSGDSREIVRCQADGTWLLAIDNPWSAGLD